MAILQKKILISVLIGSIIIRLVSWGIMLDFSLKNSQPLKEN